MEIFRTKLQQCPQCRAPLDAHGTVLKEDDGGPPATGDCAVCAYCVTILVFDAKLKLRAMSTDELMGLERVNRDKLVRIQRGLRLMNEKMGRSK